MELGAFSVSLTVSNIRTSREFYEKLGFLAIGGDVADKWLIMKNGSTVIGLFEGMFERNTLTFNPGWSADAQPLDAFTDIREIQAKLKEQGIEVASEADEFGTGPASLMILDPDGNPILIDQHV